MIEASGTPDRNGGEPKTKLFISYSRKDGVFARKFAAALQA
jgi:hypothetical protein